MHEQLAAERDALEIEITKLKEKVAVLPEVAKALVPFAALWLPEDSDPELAEGCAERDELVINRSAIRAARAAIVKASTVEGPE